MNQCWIESMHYLHSYTYIFKSNCTSMLNTVGMWKIVQRRPSNDRLLCKGFHPETNGLINWWSKWANQHYLWREVREILTFINKISPISAVGRMQENLSSQHLYQQGATFLILGMGNAYKGVIFSRLCRSQIPMRGDWANLKHAIDPMLLNRLLCRRAGSQCARVSNQTIAP